MKLNLQAIAKLRSAWHTFRDNHPNIVPFLRDVLNRGIREDMQLEVIVHYPDGTAIKSGIREGDSVIYSGNTFLADRTVINVKR